jgi:signal transduction histidine kinase
VRIVDKGVGIPKDKWDSIFDSSFTTKDRTKGTGLGLSISRRLIRNFDGDILVEASDPKKGTVILVWLPTE